MSHRFATDTERPGRQIDRRRLLFAGVLAGGLAVAGGSAAALVELAVGEARRSVNASQLVLAGSWDQLGEHLPNGQPFQLPAQHLVVVAIPATLLPAAAAGCPIDVRVGVRHGYLALSDVCPRDQCQIPFCSSSGWFECPCCGSKFSGYGEKRGGPTPRGLDMYPLIETSRGVVADKTRPVTGLPPTAQFSGQRQQGPHCA